MATSRIVCGSCEYQNVIVQAVNMCLDCDEGYCKECSKSHNAHKSSRDHKLVPIDESLKESLHVSTVCSEHGKKLDFFCPAHDDLACVKCVSEKHKQCGNLDSIEDAAYNVKSSTSLQHLEENLTSTITTVTEIINSVVTNGKSIDEQKAKIVTEIHSVKTQMMKRIDEIEANLLSDLNLKYQEEKAKLDDSKLLLENCKRNLTDIEDNTKKIKEYSNVQIFLNVRNMIKLLESENKQLFEIADSQTNINFALKRMNESEITSMMSIGQIVVSRKSCQNMWSDPTSKAAQDIKHKGKEDEESKRLTREEFKRMTKDFNQAMGGYTRRAEVNLGSMAGVDLGSLAGVDLGSLMEEHKRMQEEVKRMEERERLLEELTRKKDDEKRMEKRNRKSKDNN